MKSDIPTHQKPEERALPVPCPWDGASLLVGIFFALFNEGNGFRSKAVGHFIRSQSDPENILMVAVVILGDRNSQETALQCQPRARRGAEMPTRSNGLTPRKMVPEKGRGDSEALRDPRSPGLLSKPVCPPGHGTAPAQMAKHTNVPTWEQ